MFHFLSIAITQEMEHEHVVLEYFNTRAEVVIVSKELCL